MTGGNPPRIHPSIDHSYAARTDRKPPLLDRIIPAAGPASDRIPIAGAIPAVPFKALYPKCRIQDVAYTKGLFRHFGYNPLPYPQSRPGFD